jgi:hypothetical protein
MNIRMFYINYAFNQIKRDLFFDFLQDNYNLLNINLAHSYHMIVIIFERNIDMKTIIILALFLLQTH